MNKNKVIILTTGGTIEKSYCESSGTLSNFESLLKDSFLNHLRLPYLEVEAHEIMAKDSLDLTDQDREIILKAISNSILRKSPIIVLHGTDTMANTLKFCFHHLKAPSVPVIFTGAMKPVGFKNTDALQNLTEALMAIQLIQPGFYISFHGKLFEAPHVRKNRTLNTFETE